MIKPELPRDRHFCAIAPVSVVRNFADESFQRNLYLILYVQQYSSCQVATATLRLPRTQAVPENQKFEIRMRFLALATWPPYLGAL